jgi:hypothetical protein
MAAYLYTSYYELKLDLGLYLAIKTSDPLTLDLLPAVARGRYFWIVENWLKFRERFITYANGDQELEAAYFDFERSVQSTRLGNTTNVLTYPDKFVLYSPFLLQISFNEIAPNKEEKDYVRREIARVEAFDISSFRSMIYYLKDQHNLTAAYIGLGDEDAAALRDESVPPEKRTATVSDLVVLEQVIELEKFIEGIIIDLKNQSGVAPNLLTIGNQNLSESSTVSINDAYKSYYAVPFERSLSEMAFKYLGSTERWFELVTCNNLKAPYIDLYGEKQFLLSSGSGNAITVQDTRSEWIVLGTKVLIGSVTQKEQPRLIEKINNNKDGTLTVFLSGERNLSLWKTEDQAYARIYRPNTVNESSLIYIPVEEFSTLTRQPTPSSDELRRLDPTSLSFGVDIQRDDRTGDILLDSTGDFKKCYGLANLRQTISHIIRTARGENQWHSAFGIPTDVGNTWLSSVDESQQIAVAIQESILADPRIKDCFITDLEPYGNSLKISMFVILQNSDLTIPLSFIE